ncbi:IS3 family transposase [Oceanobacillus sojae]|uniref:IS3 family transposase n=1 Tax=Oceanobacillus sojae TaxID=582851 RepID=UPI0034C650F5
MKKELIFHEDYQTREKSKRSIFSDIQTFYNSKRIHATIGYMSPIAYEKMYLRKIAS